MTRVMVFGVFDGLHDGHVYFLREAGKLGDYLIVVVARDEVVEELKRKSPKENLIERMATINQKNLADEVITGDKELGNWEVVKKYRPDIIALGYDQSELKNELEKRISDFDWQPEIKIIPSHEPDKLHSSLL
jgi:FAD synthetase